MSANVVVRNNVVRVVNVTRQVDGTNAIGLFNWLHLLAAEEDYAYSATLSQIWIFVARSMAP